MLITSHSKGKVGLLKRAVNIFRRYGMTATPMERALRRYADLLEQFNCGASFPITAVALQRNRNLIAKFNNQTIEFVPHGNSHVDYSKVSPENQLSDLQHTFKIFSEMGATTVGFRSPYLCHSPDLHLLLNSIGYTYVSNQPIMWNVIDIHALSSIARSEYERAVAFYAPWNAEERLSLPWLDRQLVEIPVSLPDDEILIDRLGGDTRYIQEAWMHILDQTYQRGELFTLLLHPERIELCATALSAVLAKARSLKPVIWFARLDEMAAWWKERANSSVQITPTEMGGWHCVVTGPVGTTILVRGVDVDAPTQPWADGYRQVGTMSFTIQATSRPFIGLSARTSPKLADWLHQQGFITEYGEEEQHYRCYFDRPEFTGEEERLLLDQIEKIEMPLVRLGRWPNGARSAVCITGDIDALTLWDYGLRFFGK